ncbi:DUF2231 domain-containing protein [Novosphingobium sp. MBES04]|uniref:DUF2231 domain-containing protein n=1 Tax=Novosphingobium sp. MBES04 TaxID=1206458 RepID=UPI000723276A|nr:DUF2231 domain-containing protein [Novosphingobium sp. MBES04]GAM03510.1 hypothetical conserved protein [Novosphingobium sp. MBES04]
MNSVLRLFVSLALILSATVAFAHGDEKQGEEAKHPAETTAVHAQSGHDMEAMGSTAVSNETTQGHDAEQAESEGIVGALKSLHPATVHFPIALLLMAALIETFIMFRRTSEREAAVKIMIYGGAAGAVVAALFGWIHTGLWFGGDTVMQLHRWNGMLIAALGLVAAWIAIQNPQSRLAFRLTLFPIAALLIAQGYMGGELAHGLNHLKL